MKPAKLPAQVAVRAEGPQLFLAVEGVFSERPAVLITYPSSLFPVTINLLESF